MKKSYFLLTLGGLALLSISNAQASITISGATGSGIQADPYILGTGPVTITSLNPVNTNGVFAEDFWFNFQLPGDYTLHYINSSASNGGSLISDPIGMPELPIASVSDLTGNGIASVDKYDINGVFSPTNPYEFHDANNIGGPLSALSTGTGPYDLAFFGLYGNPPAGFTYSFTFQASPVSSVPLPGVAWFMMTGLMSLFGMSKYGRKPSSLPA